MWPPIEMLLNANVKTRLIPSHSPRPLSIGLMPRERITTMAAPSRPKIAVDAPTVGLTGSLISAPNEPTRSEVK
jgi:hypothetical protein